MQRSDFAELHKLAMLHKQGGLVASGIARGVSSGLGGLARGIKNYGVNLGKAVSSGKGVGWAVAKPLLPLAVLGGGAYGGAKILKAVRKGKEESMLRNPTVEA